MSLTPAADRPTSYYSYRLTVPHENWSEIKEILDDRSDNWLVALHFPDDEIKKEHFHMVLWDFPEKNDDAFKLAFSRHFKTKGNSLHQGKNHSNDIIEAISYMKQDPAAVFHHTGEAHWARLIELAPVFVKHTTPAGKIFKEKLGYPVLTYANVLKQALKYQKERCPTRRLLSDVIEEMVNTSNWWPSRELLANGIPIETHQRFSDSLSSKRTKLAFWLPHSHSRADAQGE